MKNTVYFKEMYKYIVFACMVALFVPMAMAQSPIALGKGIMVFHKNEKIVFYGKAESGKVNIYSVAIGNGALGPHRLLYAVESAKGFTPERVDLVEVKSSMPKSDIIDSIRIIRVSYKAEGEKAYARKKCKYLVLKMHKYLSYDFDNSPQAAFPQVYELKFGSANYGSAEFYACNNGLMVNYCAYPEGNTEAQALYDSKDFYKTPNYYKYCSYAIYYYDPTKRKATNMYPKDAVASYPMYAQIDVNGLMEGTEWMKKNCNYHSDCFFFYSRVHENTNNYYMQPRLLFWDACGTLTEIDVALDNNASAIGKYLDVRDEDMPAMSSTYSPDGIYSPNSIGFLLYDRKDPASKGGTSWNDYFNDYLARNGNQQLSVFGAKETLSNGQPWARYYYVSFGSKTYSLKTLKSGMLSKPVMVKAKYDITSFKRAETTGNNATYIIRHDGNYKTAFIKNLRDYCDKGETGYGAYYDVQTSNLSMPFQFSEYGLCFVLENGDNTLFAALTGGKFYHIPALDSVLPAKFKLGSVVDLHAQGPYKPLLLTSNYTDYTYDYRFLGTVSAGSSGYRLTRWKEGNLSYKLVDVIGGNAAVLTDRKFHDFSGRTNPITNFIVKNLDGSAEKVSAKVTLTGDYSRAKVINLKSEFSNNLGYIHIYNYDDGEYKGKGKMFYYSESNEKIPKVKELTFEPDFNKVDIDEENSDMSHLIYEVDGVVKVMDIFTYSER